MFWNWILAVVNGLVQVALILLGFEVTVTKQPLSASTKRKYRIGFIVCALISSGLAVFVALRGVPERAHLKVDPSPGNASVIGEQMLFNVNFENVGGGPAINMADNGRAFIQPDRSLASARDAVDKFQKWLESQPEMLRGTSTLPKSSKQFTSWRGDVLTPEDIENVKAGRRIVYLVGNFTFEDDAGKHEHQVCRSLYPPIKTIDSQPNAIVWLQPGAQDGYWGTCPVFNEEK